MKSDWKMSFGGMNGGRKDARIPMDMREEKHS